MTVNPITEEVGIGPTVSRRWRRELRQHSSQTFTGNRRTRDEELSHLWRELARVTKERDFLHEAATFLARAPR